ncbi:MAG: hypothetical protein USCAAHI_02689 [Beijerinckiaceae bacterium]|nr:MAG: hypothetical protein USCAAHI_02689 [Beijerinckiaceae bacterium]
MGYATPPQPEPSNFGVVQPAGLVAVVADPSGRMPLSTILAMAEDAHALSGPYARALWRSVSMDATRVEEGVTASDIASSRLWPQGQPYQLRALWREMKATLVFAEQDWQVWTLWYDDRLDGHVWREDRELAYVRIEEALWHQGSALVNAEIKRRWNARPDYAETLDQYVAYLPVQSEEGNFLLADAEARVIRSMFAAEAKILPVPLATNLKVFLEQHIGLRSYYPETEDFYESVRSGHLEAPLPIDAVEGFILGVRDNTPTVFEPNVSQALEEVAQPIPTVTFVDAKVPRSARRNRLRRG